MDHSDFITYQGGKIRYSQFGHGPDIFFIHGAPGSIDDWLPIKDGLASKYRLTLFDRPGYGQSEPLKNGYNQERQADVCLALIDKLKLKNPVVVGHSLGGSIALAMAVRKPSHIKAFVCVGTRAFPKDKAPLIFHLLRKPILGSVLLGIMRRKPDLLRSAIIKMFHPNDSSIPHDFIQTRTTLWLESDSMISLAHEDTNSNTILRKIGQHYHGLVHPFTLVHGEEDRNVPPENAKKLHGNIINSKLYILPGTGHMVQFIKTAELVKIISAAADNVQTSSTTA